MSSGEAEPKFPAAEHFPCYEFPEAAARVLAKAAAYADWRRRPPGVVVDFLDADIEKARGICDRALKVTGAGWLPVDQAWRVLEAMGLPVLPGAPARTSAEAAAAAGRIGFPVAVKLTSRQLVHKSEVGGVVLNLADEQAVRRAFTDIQKRLAEIGQLDAMDGVYVQPMAPAGTEVMVGVTSDSLFGPLVAFGLGGVHVEILGDVCFRITPLTDRDAADMVRSIRGYRLLQGYRGKPAADIPALETVLLRVARLIEAVPAIAELDLNPIVALPSGQGCRIADVRIRVEPGRDG
jgi:acyl-CoA synthetase (NDP forming)